VAVPNTAPELGQVHSTALALEAALELGHTWALIALVDHPAVRVATVKALAARAREEPGAVHLPTWRGERGHPAALPTALAPALHEARAGEGARDVIARLGVVVREHSMEDPGVLVDVDTEADLERWRSGRTP
jgi:molybdenum cofactor cytidylyltransferase